MKLEHLRKFRIVVSLAFFIPTTLLFLDFAGLFPHKWISGLLYLQFIPSLVKFIAVLDVAVFGFVIAVVFTLVFGRVYCSTICPLGTLQDVVSYFARRIRRKKHHKQIRSFNGIRYGILAATVLLAVGGSMFLVTLLDPFSSFGRIVTDILKPIVVLTNNALSWLLQNVGSYAVYPVDLKVPVLSSLLVSIAVVSLVVWMSSRHGRLYCNTVCPVGALLGVMSKVSIYQIHIDQSACIGCKLCEQTCKGGCIDKQEKIVDFTRCVGCYNCFAVCPTEAVVFARRPETGETRDVLWEGEGCVRVPSREAEHTDFGRRDAVLKSILFLTGTTSVGKKRIVATKESTVKIVRSAAVTPPGSQSSEHFVNACTACHLCISACPSQVLSPSFLEYGLGGIMQPYMDFLRGFCNFECTLCTEICPTGAILPLAREEKKVTQLGVAKFVKENCIVETENTECGACSEHCPTKAVNMVPFKQLVIPEVKEEYCIGCGACEHACPTKPYKAIYVEGKSVHAKAKKPKQEKLPETIPEEFPF